jgi:small subunit ribosomal protein S16
MPAKIRLARHGRKGHAFYHIVIADSRAPRDGKYVERLGSYNPNTNPATITLDFDKALSWLNNGAQPTETVNSILRKEGVLFKKHLLKGVAKGAFTIDVAEQKFDVWKSKNETKVSKLKNQISSETKAKEKKRLEAESKKNEKRIAAIAEANAKKAKAKEAENEVEAAETAEPVEPEESTEVTETPEN